MKHANSSFIFLFLSEVDPHLREDDEKNDSSDGMAI